MIDVAIPGRASLQIKHLVLDLNGTLALDGVLMVDVADRLQRLRHDLSIHLLSADTLGMAAQTAQDLQVMLQRTEPHDEAESKRRLVLELGPDNVAAIGAGLNDVQMLRTAALGIAVLGPEGLAVATLNAADVLAPSVHAALDLLLVPTRLIATLRS